MPVVGGKHFPYTAAGKMAAKKAQKMKQKRTSETSSRGPVRRTTKVRRTIRR